MSLFRRGAATALFLSLFLAACSSGPSGPRIDFNDQVIVAFGNSITAGVGDSSYPSRASGYPYRLEALLNERFPNAIVLNRGVPGERTVEGVRRLNSVLARDNPDYVLILEGVNNIRDGSASAVSEIIPDLEAMVQAVKSSGATPLLGTLLPTWGPHGFQNSTIERVNPLIAGLAAREKIALVDLNAAFLRAPDLTALYVEDGLHPNDLGYDLMAQTWYDGLFGRL